MRIGGTQTPKHILRATRLEEDPGVSRGESHLLALGVARTRSSAACWQQPREYDLAGMVRGAPQAQRRTDGEGGRGEGTIIRRGFGEILEGTGSGRLFFVFFLFPSSPMWKRHSARRKTGVDRTRRQKDRQASYPPPDLKEEWKQIVNRKKNKYRLLHM